MSKSSLVHRMALYFGFVQKNISMHCDPFVRRTCVITESISRPRKRQKGIFVPVDKVTVSECVVTDVSWFIVGDNYACFYRGPEREFCRRRSREQSGALHPSPWRADATSWLARPSRARACRGSCWDCQQIDVN